MNAQWVRTGLVAILSLSLIGGIAVAQQPTDQPSQTLQSPMGFQPKLEKTKDLIGAKVINRDGTRLGTIEDIVLTPQRDAISYVALSSGGVMGIGSKLLAVPWSAFEVRPQEQGRVIVLNVDEGYLKTAQGFDKDHWPLTADKSWPSGIGSANVPGERAYPPQANERMEPGMAPTARENTASQPTAGTDINYLRLSKLVGTTVKDSDGADLGKLSNVMIDVHGGKVAYGILSVNRDVLGTDRNLAAIPWSAIRIDPEQRTAMLNVDRETLRSIAFDENHFPNLADPQYSRDLYQRFNARPYWEALGFVPGEEQEHNAVRPESSNPGAPGTQYDQPRSNIHERAGCQ